MHLLTENPPAHLVMAHPAGQDNREAMLTGADRCVMCGLCLPHCPTYVLSENENRSPRGRIALIKALAADQLEASAGLSDHLDSCLLCRSCEAMCPSKVAYSELFDRAQAMLASSGSKRQPWQLRLLQYLVASRRRLKMLGMLLHAYQRSGFQWLMRRKFIERVTGRSVMAHLLPRLAAGRHGQTYYPAVGQRRDDVMLFTGCISNIVEQPVINACITVLTRLGYGVHIPEAQVCCGALHRHSGDAQIANVLLDTNSVAFNSGSTETLLTFATGCGATLKTSKQLGNRVMDINEFLETRDWSIVRFRPSAKRIMLHMPCTSRYAMQADDSIYRLLQLVPNTEVLPLPENNVCCGAGGGNLLSYPDIAAQLRARKVSPMRSEMPDLLLTTNTGCAVQLKTGIAEQGLRIEVKHPVEYIAAHLD